MPRGWGHSGASDYGKLDISENLAMAVQLSLCARGRV